MSPAGRWRNRRRIDVPCTIEIEQTHDFFHAHVELDGDLRLRPGDRVLVLGEPIRVGFGEKLSVRRAATLERAGWLARAWTRLAATLDLGELYDVSFTSRRMP